MKRWATLQGLQEVTRPLHKRLYAPRKRRERTAQAVSTRLMHASFLGVTLSLIVLLLLEPLSRSLPALALQVLQSLDVPAWLEYRPLQIGGFTVVWQVALNARSTPVDGFILGMHLVVTLAVLVLGWWVRSTPIRYVLRTLCLLHAASISLLWLQADAHLHGLASHTRLLGDLSWLWLLMSPAMLALGFFLVERNWTNRLLASLVFFGWQFVAMPVRLVLHSMLVVWFSEAMIPLLFFAAGPLLDVLLLSALYTWVMSWPALRGRRAQAPASAGGPSAGG